MDEMNEMEYAVVDHKGDPVYHDETAIGAFNWAEVNLADDRYTVELMDKPSEPKMTDAEVAGMFIDAAKDLSKRRRLADKTSLNAEQVDKVNNPSHYTQGGIECIDAMEAMLSRDEFIGYLRGNIFKYQWRYKDKNGMEDLKKANWYSAKLIELEELDGKHKPQAHHFAHIERLGLMCVDCMGLV